MLGYKIRFVPVVLEHRYEIDRDHYSYEHLDDSTWIDDGDSYDGVRKTEIEYYSIEHEPCKGTSDEVRKSIEIYTAGNDMLASLYEIDKNKTEKLHAHLYNSIEPSIYYMGLGYKIGSHERRGMHIGNQCTGCAKDNVYLNIMMVCYR